MHGPPAAPRVGNPAFSYGLDPARALRATLVSLAFPGHDGHDGRRARHLGYFDSGVLERKLRWISIFSQALLHLQRAYLHPHAQRSQSPLSAAFVGMPVRWNMMDASGRKQPMPKSQPLALTAPPADGPLDHGRCQLIVASDPPFRVLMTSVGWLRLNGYSEPEVVGRPFTIVQGADTCADTAAVMAAALQVPAP